MVSGLEVAFLPNEITGFVLDTVACLASLAGHSFCVRSIDSIQHTLKESSVIMLLRSISASFVTVKMTVKIKPVNNTTQVNFGIPDQ